MPVIFISRGTMSGVQQLVEQFYAKTGIRCISRENLLEIVARHGEWAIKAVQKLSQATSAYDQFSQLRRSYVVLIRQALLQELCKDNILYHGFSGHLLVPRIAHFVRIRIDAPLEIRIRSTKERFGFDEEKARSYILEKDEQRVQWARFTYGRDIRDSSLYDLHFCLGHIPMTVVCRTLEHFMSDPDLQANEESKELVERLLLITNIEAALVCDPRTRNFDVHANIKEDRIDLIGPYLHETDKTLVMEIAGKTAQNYKIDYTPGFATRLDIDGWQAFTHRSRIL